MRTKTKINICPCCGNILDTVIQFVGDPRPTPGDITFCAECLQPFIFTRHMERAAYSKTDMIVMRVQDKDLWDHIMNAVTSFANAKKIEGYLMPVCFFTELAITEDYYKNQNENG